MSPALSPFLSLAREADVITYPFPKRKSQYRRLTASRRPPTPVALTLVAANFDPDGPITYLTFDRAVDYSAAVPSEFAVADGPDNGQFVGISVGAGGDPTQVAVTMNRTGGYSGDTQLLTVGSGNGIVAVDDGGTYAGVTDLVLPVP